MKHKDNPHSGAEEYRRQYHMRDSTIDTEFGIKFTDNGQPYIGKTPITIQGNDIIIGREVYHGTEGLWELLTEKIEENFMHQYNDDDMENYYHILNDTNVLRHNFDPESTRPRSSASWKWKHILSKIWEKIKANSGSSDEEEEEELFFVFI